eukprot:241174_1
MMTHRFTYHNSNQWNWDSLPSSPQSKPKPVQKPRHTKKTNPARNIKIKIFHPNGHCVILHVQPTIMISDIKTKIDNRMGIATNTQKLVFQGEELNDDSTWIESNFPTAIFLLILEPQTQMVGASIDCFVCTLSGKTIRLNVNEMDRIKTIKERIEHEEGIAASHQRLIFAGQELDDTNVLSHYHIESGSTLYSSLRFRNYSLGCAYIQIDIRTNTDKTLVVLNVERSTTIHDVKRMIEEKTNVLFPFDLDGGDEPIQLMFAEQCLENALRLSDYNIYNHSTLYLQSTNHAYDHYYDAYMHDEAWETHDNSVLLSPRSSTSGSAFSSLCQIPEIKETFDIYIRIPQMDRIIQFEVDPNDTLQSIKTQIEMEETIPVEEQILTYLQRELDDDKTLCHYSIECESELQLTLQGFAKFVAEKLM